MLPAAAVSARLAALLSAANTLAPRRREAARDGAADAVTGAADRDDLAVETNVHGLQKLQQVVVGKRPLAVLDLVDQGDQPGNGRGGDAVAGADLGDRGDLHIHLGAAFAHGEIAPYAGMGFRAVPVEFDDAGHRLARRPSGASGMKAAGSNIGNFSHPHALGRRHRQRLARQRPPHRQHFRPRQAVGDAEVAERLGEQHGAVAELAPQVAPDVVGDDGVRLEVAHDAQQFANRGVMAPSSSPSTTELRLPNSTSPGAIQSVL